MTGLPSFRGFRLPADTVLEKSLQIDQQLHEDDINHGVHGPFLVSRTDRPASNQSRPVAGPIVNSESLITLPFLT